MDIKEIERKKQQTERYIEKTLEHFMNDVEIENKDVSVDVSCRAYKATDWKYRAWVDITIKI